MSAPDLLPPGPSPRAGAKPLLYWAGGKSSFVPLVMPGVHRRLTSTGGRYVDPFLGGGAFPLDLGIAVGPWPRMLLSDVLAPLVDVYCAVRDRPQELWTLLEALAEDTTETRYLAVREIYNATLDVTLLDRPGDDDVRLERASMLLYLNALAHSGLYRTNKAGHFNVPYGHQAAVAADRRLPSQQELADASCALRAAEISCNDFGYTVAAAQAGDVLVADPPYHQTFTDYAAHVWNDDEQARLAKALWRAHERGAAIVAFNNDTELVRSLYEGFCQILPTSEARTVRGTANERARARCVIMTTDLGLLGD